MRGAGLSKRFPGHQVVGKLRGFFARRLRRRSASRGGNLTLGDIEIQSVRALSGRPSSGRTKAGRLNLGCFFHGKPAKIVEYASEQHAAFVQNIASQFPTMFPDVLANYKRFVIWDWVPGETLHDFSRGGGGPVLSDMAELQASLHALSTPLIEPEFDYVGMLVNRVSAYSDFQPIGECLADARATIEGTPVGVPMISHPDLVPNNLIRGPNGCLVSIDNELIGLQSCTGLDLCNTVHALRRTGNDPARTYIAAYRQSGGILPIKEREPWLTAVWCMRRVGSACSSNRLGEAESIARAYLDGKWDDDGLLAILC